MKKIVLLFVFVLAASVYADYLYPNFTYTPPTAAEVGNGVYYDLDKPPKNTTYSGNPSNKWTQTSSTKTAEVVGQNFVPTNSFTLDKIAIDSGFHVSAPTITLSLPGEATGAELQLSVWEYTGAGGIPAAGADAQQYAVAMSGAAGASATVAGNWIKIATFTEWISKNFAIGVGYHTVQDTSMGWFIFDVPNTLSLTAGKTYAYASVWVNPYLTDLGTKGIIYRRQLGYVLGSTQDGMGQGSSGVAGTYLVPNGSTGSYALIATPEPTTIALLSLGSLMFLRKRK